jgi:CheY-like chemotaxis protein
LLSLGNEETRVDVELDALRAMQLIPQQYDLIVIDSMLDAMDGLQLLLLFKQQAPAAKFIVVSEVPDELSRLQAYQNGADLFLERPRTPEAFNVILQSIHDLLKRHRESRLQDSDRIPLVSIADIVQTHCLSGDSVLLLVRGKQQSGDIFIFRGEVYHAQYPGKGGEEAFDEIIRWDGGHARVKTLKLTHLPPRTIEVPYRKLLERLEEPGTLEATLLPASGELVAVATDGAAEERTASVVQEAPPLSETSSVPTVESIRLAAGETPLPPVNSHWKVNLMGELVEGSQVAEAERCTFITNFIYRKLADVAVALEVDYFNTLTLLGPHLQQVLVADNLGVRHAVFETAWTNEAKRLQYIKWCSEQSF